MNFSDFLDKVMSHEKKVLNDNSINLHKENMSVETLLELPAGHESNKNTMVILRAGSNRLRGSKVYFYDREDVTGKIWLEGYKPRLSMIDIVVKGFSQALIEMDNEFVDYDLLDRIEASGAKFTVHYSVEEGLDLGAIVTIDTIGFIGSAPLELEMDCAGPLSMEELLAGGNLD